MTQEYHSQISFIPALFIHIQKTAGSSIVDSARNHYGSHNVVSHGDYLKWITDGKSRSSLNAKESGIEQLQQIPFISGHFGYDFAQPFRHNRYLFTFLRNPIERILSYYYFCRKRDPNEFRVYKLSQVLSLEDFLKLGLSEPTIKACIWNNQAWQLAHGYGNRNGRNILMFTPQEILELSLNHLDDFSYIGFAESFEEDRSRLFKELGIKLPDDNIMTNSNPGRPTTLDMPSSTIDLLHQLTELDQIVYKTAISRMLRPPDRKA